MSVVTYGENQSTGIVWVTGHIRSKS